MSKFGGFLDNLASGALSPKGNLGDFRHASKTTKGDSGRILHASGGHRNY